LGLTKRAPEECQDLARVWEDAARRGLLTQDVANSWGVSLRRANYLRRQIEFTLGIKLPSLGGSKGVETLPRFEHYKIDKKKVRAIIASDWHIWPGEVSFAERIFLKTLEDHTFDYVILNGDVTDQPSVSRHGALRGEERLALVDELEEAQARVKEVERRCKKAKRLFTWGNHDERLDKNIARNAPELAGLKGTTLEDYFKKWHFCLSIDINGRVVIKHSWHSSIHAAHANAVKSGKTMITGHTHRLLTRPYNDYTGIRYGIETGTLAGTMGPQFRYVDNNPRDWHPGFLILETELYKDGSMDVRPQLVDCTLKKPVVYGQTVEL